MRSTVFSIADTGPPSNVSGIDLGQVVRRLRATHQFDYLGNLKDPVDELVYIVLSTRTRFEVFQRTFAHLRRRFSTWDDVLHADDMTLQRLLAPAGLSEKKARWLKEALSEIEHREGRISLDHLAEMSDTDAEDYLTSLPGIGLKTARCLLMYSLGRDVLPVDANVRRLLERLEVIPGGIHYYDIHDAAQQQVPRDLRRDLHIYSVLHGQTICRPRKPQCSGCSLHDICPYPGSSVLEKEER